LRRNHCRKTVQPKRRRKVAKPAAEPATMGERYEFKIFYANSLLFARRTANMGRDSNIGYTMIVTTLNKMTLMKYVVKRESPMLRVR